MFLAPISWLPRLVVFCGLLSNALAVDVRGYTGLFCNGDRYSCGNIPSLACCNIGGANLPPIQSFSCVGCDSSDTHSVFVGGQCNLQDVVTRGGSNNCITYFSEFATGQRWCRNCWNNERAAGTLSAEPPCTHTIEPDTVRIAGRVFQLNGTMTQTQREMLYGFFSKGMRADSIPSVFDEFEIPDDDPEK